MHCLWCYLSDGIKEKTVLPRLYSDAIQERTESYGEDKKCRKELKYNQKKAKVNLKMDKLTIDVTNIPKHKYNALVAYVEELKLECELVQDE